MNESRTLLEWMDAAVLSQFPRRCVGSSWSLCHAATSEADVLLLARLPYELDYAWNDIDYGGVHTCNESRNSY